MTAILLTGALGLADQARERVLDLTRTPATSNPAIAPRDIQNCRLGGRGAGQSGGPPSFTISIESIDKVQYAMGGQITIDLKLTNTSTRSVPIPTVLLDQFIDPFESEEAIQFGFSIMLRDAQGQEHDFTATSLRGSTKIPLTTEILGPGESIKIHFPGHVAITDDASAPPTGEGQLVAYLLIKDGECRRWTPVQSNAIEGVRFIGR